MTKFKIGGTIISAGSLVLAGLFIWGLAAGEPWRFWAIAAPVIVGFLAALGIAFSIGRLMSSTEVQDTSAGQPEEKKEETTSTTAS